MCGAPFGSVLGADSAESSSSPPPPQALTSTTTATATRMRAKLAAATTIPPGPSYSRADRQRRRRPEKQMQSSGCKTAGGPGDLRNGQEIYRRVCKNYTSKNGGAITVLKRTGTRLLNRLAESHDCQIALHMPCATCEIVVIYARQSRHAPRARGCNFSRHAVSEKHALSLRSATTWKGTRRTGSPRHSMTMRRQSSSATLLRQPFPGRSNPRLHFDLSNATRSHRPHRRRRCLR